jgi:hypothetical protein
LMHQASGSLGAREPKFKAGEDGVGNAAALGVVVN